jgi:hypothetical protein
MVRAKMPEFGTPDTSQLPVMSAGGGWFFVAVHVPALVPETYAPDIEDAETALPVSLKGELLFVPEKAIFRPLIAPERLIPFGDDADT